VATIVSAGRPHPRSSARIRSAMMSLASLANLAQFVELKLYVTHWDLTTFQWACLPCNGEARGGRTDQLEVLHIAAVPWNATWPRGAGYRHLSDCWALGCLVVMS